MNDQYDCWREKLVAGAGRGIDPRSQLPAAEAGSAKGGGAILSGARRAADDAGHGGPGAPVSARPEQGAVHGVSAAAQAQGLAEFTSGVATVPRALPQAVSLAVRGRHHRISYFCTTSCTRTPSACITATKFLSARRFASTRNSNLYLREEESRSILDSVDSQLHRRRKGAAVRLEIEAGADPEIIERLRSNFRLAAWQVFQVHGPVNLSRLFNLYDQTPRPDLKFTPFVPKELPIPHEPPALFQLFCASATSCCITRTIPIRRSFASSKARRRIPTCFPSSRRSTAPARIRRSCAR